MVKLSIIFFVSLFSLFVLLLFLVFSFFSIKIKSFASFSSICLLLSYFYLYNLPFSIEELSDFFELSIFIIVILQNYLYFKIIYFAKLY
jgi:hypothetical protein